MSFSMRVAADVLARLHVPLVAVDPPDEDGLAVHEDLPALRLDLAEADAPRHDAEGLPGAVLQGEEEGVEVRLLVRPLQRVRHLRFDRHLRRLAGGDPAGLGHGAQDGPPGRVEEGRLERERLLRGGRAADRHVHLQRGVAVLRVEVGRHAEVVDAQRARGPEDDVAEDARHPPEVLALEVRPVREAVHLGGQQVLAGLHEVGEVELGRAAAVLAVADLLPVHPEVEARGDAVERDPHAAAAPVGGHVEAVAVRADVVELVRDARRRAPAPGVADVDVDRGRVAVLLDVRRAPGSCPRPCRRRPSRRTSSVATPASART